MVVVGVVGMWAIRACSAGCHRGAMLAFSRVAKLAPQAMGFGRPRRMCCALASIACRNSIIILRKLAHALRALVIWNGLATPVPTHPFAQVGS